VEVVPVAPPATPTPAVAPVAEAPARPGRTRGCRRQVPAELSPSWSCNAAKKVNAEFPIYEA